MYGITGQAAQLLPLDIKNNAQPKELGAQITVDYEHYR